MYEKDYKRVFGISFARYINGKFYVMCCEGSQTIILGMLTRPVDSYYGWLFIPAKKFKMASTMGLTRCMAVEACFHFEKEFRKKYGYPSDLLPFYLDNQEVQS